jgi:hypothetical protein
VNTKSQGVFTDTLSVPANATDGLHYVYAAFAPQGAYGPSTNFTSIIVYRLPLNLTIKTPLIIIPGFPTKLTGFVKANGSALANSLIQLNTPWGTFNTTTNSHGRFSLSFKVPLTEFAFGKQVTVIASPIEPYFAIASNKVLLDLLNLILVAIIISVAGFGIYQARNLGIRPPKIMRRKQEESLVSEPKIEHTIRVPWEPFSVPLLLPGAWKSSIITSYVEALSLAAKKFGIQFARSMTIRETIDVVLQSDKGGKGSSLFSNIALATEDYVYSRRKEHWRNDEVMVQDSLSKLRALWSTE